MTGILLIFLEFFQVQVRWSYVFLQSCWLRAATIWSPNQTQTKRLLFNRLFCLFILEISNGCRRFACQQDARRRSDCFFGKGVGWQRLPISSYYQTISAHLSECNSPSAMAECILTMNSDSVFALFQFGITVTVNAVRGWTCPPDENSL